MINLKEFKTKFDREINQYLDNKIQEAEKIDKKAPDLIKIVKEFINYGGKRFRPAIFYYAYQSYSQRSLEKIFKLSFIFELFQTFALIHDDIIDKADLRRNWISVNKKYGIETAILAGDTALMLADELFYEICLEKPKINKLYNRFKQDTIIGQYFDLIKLCEVEKIIDLKTSRYSFIYPGIIGMTLAKASREEIQKWAEILKEVGFIFQLKDDFNGIFADEKIFGKPITSDLKEGKNTFIIKQFLLKATEKEKIKFYSFFGKQKVNHNHLNWIKKILNRKGIVEKIKKTILNRSNKIRKELSKFSRQTSLTSLINLILIRINEF
ncbi:MAG: polyprenyl synthetase family protein [Microgenomates group bacterium]|nr:polyprenyl synthetase family protein [Microgenomates group bacterium]